MNAGFQRWIIEHPEILGLGTVDFIGREIKQVTGGRLDLLLEDRNNNIRYAVELQLGALDESHIIRTIEYWDVERRRSPQFQHVAVIVAEDVTSRFLNVISLLNRSIPLIAVQLKAIESGDAISLIANRVVDLIPIEENGDPPTEEFDRNYWEKNKPQAGLKIIDELHSISQEIEPDTELRYTKNYISAQWGNRIRKLPIDDTRSRERRLGLEIAVPGRNDGKYPRVRSSICEIQFLV